MATPTRSFRSKAGGGRRGGGVATRRKRIWARTVGALPAVTGADGARLNLLSAFETSYGAQLIGCTVARTLITFAATSAATSPAGLITGVLVATSADVTETQVNPLAEPGADWMYWRGSYFVDSTAGTRITETIDIRAMRKIDELNEALMFFAVGVDPTLTFNVQLTASVLILLP